jgi:hypothetical protein
MALGSNPQEEVGHVERDAELDEFSNLGRQHVDAGIDVVTLARLFDKAYQPRALRLDYAIGHLHGELAGAHGR